MSNRRPEHIEIDDAVWADPADPNEVAWRLRFGKPTRADVLYAAEVIDNYRRLILTTRAHRQSVVSKIRALMGHVWFE